ncbi:MAG: hypothetical protein QOD94_2216 [Alphaproteobacteria bacterium]|nr:hypothetical protein [Alphaproteobacteria bacterium]
MRGVVSRLRGADPPALPPPLCFRAYRPWPKGRRPVPAGHEIKHDGYRLQIHLRDGRVRLFTRTGFDWTDRYPWIVEDAARPPVEQVIIDAECCCADDDGLTDFDAPHSRVNDDAAFAYAFDLLLIDGEDIRRAPLTERKLDSANCSAEPSQAFG